MVGGLAIAAGAAAAPSAALTPSSGGGFPPWFAGPLAALPGVGLSKAGAWLLLAAMGACYLAVLALAGSVTARAAVAAIGFLHLVFALAPPLLSTDLFGYLAAARVGALEGLSPYSAGAGALAGDPVSPYLVWRSRPNPYGPLFTVATYPLASLSVAGGLWTIKALTAAASLGTVALVWRAARGLARDPVPAALYVGLNPLLVVWGVGGGHNDLPMMLLATGAVALLVSRRDVLGGATMAGATAIKASAGLLLPPLVIGAYRRGRALAGVVGGGTVALLLAVAVVGPAVAELPTELGRQAELVSVYGPAQLAGEALGLGGATPGVRLAGTLMVIAALVLLCVRVWRGGDPIAAAGWTVLVALAATAWLMPWYVVWVLPLAALATPGRALRAASLGLCAFIVATRASLPVL